MTKVEMFGSNAQNHIKQKPNRACLHKWRRFTPSLPTEVKILVQSALMKSCSGISREMHE